MARKPTDTVKLNLRFPESLRRQLERRAEAKKHSMNTEIIRMLEECLRNEDMKTAVTYAVEKGIANSGLVVKTESTK